jgi:hypothetical protein
VPPWLKQVPTKIVESAQLSWQSNQGQDHRAGVAPSHEDEVIFYFADLRAAATAGKVCPGRCGNRNGLRTMFCGTDDIVLVPLNG